MENWLKLYKKAEVVERTYDRIESTFLTHIVDSNLGRMQEQAITSDDIQLFMLQLHNHSNPDKELKYGGQETYSRRMGHNRFIYCQE